MFVESYEKARRVRKRQSTEYLVWRAIESALLEGRLSGKRMRSLYWRTVPRALRMRTYDVDDYSGNIDPFQVFRVDPAEISKLTGRVYPDKYRIKRIGAVWDGEWDRKRGRDIYPGYPYDFYDAERFEETVLYRSLRERFEDGVPWEETEVVRSVIELIDRGHSVWHGCSSETEVRERCATLDELYRSMRETGYKQPAELKESEGIISETLNQIVVDVGRDGELLFADGRHRLAVAKILGLDAVPIVVLVRHRRYMERVASGSAVHDDTLLERYDEGGENDSKRSVSGGAGCATR